MFPNLGYSEMLLFGVVALILFGGRLPEVARNFGRTYRELRRKVDDFQREFRDWDKPDYPHSSSSKPLLPYRDLEDKNLEPTAPKFVPPKDDDDTDRP